MKTKRIGINMKKLLLFTLIIGVSFAVTMGIDDETKAVIEYKKMKNKYNQSVKKVNEAEKKIEEIYQKAKAQPNFYLQIIGKKYHWLHYANWQSPHTELMEKLEKRTKQEMKKIKKCKKNLETEKKKLEIYKKQMITKMINRILKGNPYGMTEKEVIIPMDKIDILKNKYTFLRKDIDQLIPHEWENFIKYGIIYLIPQDSTYGIIYLIPQDSTYGMIYLIPQNSTSEVIDLAKTHLYGHYERIYLIPQDSTVVESLKSEMPSDYKTKRDNHRMFQISESNKKNNHILKKSCKKNFKLNNPFE